MNAHATLTGSIFALAVFFACKSEGQHITLSEFCRIGRLPEGTEAFIRSTELEFLSDVRWAATNPSCVCVCVCVCVCECVCV
jgi:hypothetical protein